MKEGILDSTSFELAGVRAFSWREVFTALQASGVVQEVRETLVRKDEALRAATARGEAPPAEAIEAAAVDFRRKRQLLAAADLSVWLEKWGLDVEEWRDALTLNLLSEPLSTEEDEARNTPPTALLKASSYLRIDGGVPEFSLLWAELVCSGRLMSGARRLAESLTAAVILGHNLPTEELTISDAEELEAARAEFVGTLINPTAITKEIAVNRLEWTSVEVEGFFDPNEAVIKEVLCCHRYDGESFASLGKRTQLTLLKEQRLLSELPDSERGWFLGVRAGEAVGPLQREGGYWAGSIISKTPPSSENEVLVELAQRLTIKRGLAAAMAERIIWR